MDYFTNDTIKNYVVNLRRYFHENPELSGEEINTTKRIKKELEELKVPYQELNPTTIVAWLGEGEKKIALRGDTDALPINEVGDKEYKSKKEGVMHGCGHDGHISMLLGAIKCLNEKRDVLNGKIYFCFQPAEEIGKGAQEILDFLDEQGGVDEVFAIHLWSLIPVGKICVSSGARMAGGGSFSIKVLGIGGHSSRPDQCVDPLKIASKILLEITSIPSNRVSTLEPAVVSVGKLYGGTKRNIIPGEAYIEGGFRTFSSEVSERVLELIKEISEGIAKYSGGKVEITSGGIFPCLFNHTSSSKIAHKVVTKLLGEDAVYEFEPLLASENFSLYTDRYSGMMAFVGAGNREKGVIHPHHHPSFDIDESALINGMALYVEYALEFLSI